MTALAATVVDGEARRAAHGAATPPLISVITPSYNQGCYIERCIQSVRAQGYRRCEHIIYDNCSTDGTPEILRRYPHLTWASEPDRGQSDALNKALRRARGEIIAWINADDYYEPGVFDLVARELARDTGVSILLGRVHLVDAAGRVLKTTEPYFRGHEHLIDAWSHGHGLSQPGMFLRRAALDRVGLFDTRLHYAMDYDLWLRLTRYYPIKVVDQVLASFRVHPESKTTRSRYLTGFRREQERVSRRYWGSIFTLRYWRFAQACQRWSAEALTHAILDGHKRGGAFPWRCVAELVWRRPQAVLYRHLLVALGEQLVRSVAKHPGRAPEAAPAEPALANGRVTVVIPTYNRAAWVERAIQSALRQTACVRCDIVVIDDGSTDDTPRVLARYAGEIRSLRQRNRGVSAARNAALRGQRNEFVAFLDSDDEWAPDKMARQLDALERYPAAVFVATHGLRRAADGTTWSPELPPTAFGQPVDLAPHFFRGLFVVTSGVMVRARHLPADAPFSTSLPMCEDYLLWLRLACRGPAIILNAPLVTCGWNAPASLADDLRRVQEAQIRVRYLARSLLRQRPDCAAAWRTGLAGLLAVKSKVAARRGQHFSAARLALRSLLVQPWGRPRWEWGACAQVVLRCLSTRMKE